MSKGILGDLFDFNRDGHLDCIEQAAEFAFLQDAVHDRDEDDFSVLNAMADYFSDDADDSY